MAWLSGHIVYSQNDNQHACGLVLTQGLSPIRTQNWSNGSSRSGSSTSQRKYGLVALRGSLCHLYKQLVSQPSDSKLAFDSGMPHSMTKPVHASQDLRGFWKAQKQIVLDIWAVLHGDERRAVRMALWIALIDQAMGSTAVVNYAPQVPLHPAQPQPAVHGV